VAIQHERERNHKARGQQDARLSYDSSFGAQCSKSDILAGDKIGLPRERVKAVCAERLVSQTELR